MRRTILASALLVLSVSGCSDDDNDEGSGPSPASNPSPTASASYVAQVNALCEAMIPRIMAVRGDSDGDGGGDIPTMDEFEAQENQIRPVHDEFDAKVDAIPVTDSDRGAADAFKAYRDFLDADTEKTLTAARAGDQAAYDAGMGPPSAEFEAKRAPVAAAGIDCPAR